MNVKFSKSDVYLIVIFFIVAIPVTISGYNYKNGLFEPIMDTVIYCISTLFLTYVIVYKLYPRYFSKNQIIRLFFWTVLLMMIVGIIEIICYRLVIGKEILPLFKRYELGFWGVTTSAQNAGILIGLLLGKKFTDVQLDLQKRDTEKRENELRLLKSQVDPHFLFNNLNTIDALIDTDPKAAKLYLNKLAKLYRYLIHTKDDEVVSVDEEIAFAKNYAFLLEQRYGTAYTFYFETDGKNDQYFIPPGALQTCLENVVKHNSGTESNPIITRIKVSKGSIIVINNKMQKTKQLESTGIGLSNLKSRYQLLSNKDLTITSDKDFSIKLPLIKSVE